MLSIIIPTFNEKHNVVTVCERICQALQGEQFEIIFVDDSTDETPFLLAKLAQEKSQVSYLHRTAERGLATAVAAGFQLSRGEILTVLDADLQHPPELLPSLLTAVRAGSDIVIPSRFILGGSDGGLSQTRKIISKSARFLTWLVLKKSRCTTDPMSGFFMFRKNLLEGKELQPVGWKILLEILVKTSYQRVTEVPYAFQQRANDRSKMTLQEQWNFLRHLCRLFLASPADNRFWKFSLVGLSGVVINLLLYTFFVQVCELNVVLAGICSAFFAMFSNFILNDLFTWKTENNQPFFARLIKFYIYCSIGIFLNTVLLIILYEYLNLNYLFANLLGILIASLWNFSSNNKWTWAPIANEIIADDGSEN